MADFSELLREAEKAGFIDKKQAAQLRAEARTDKASATTKLQAAIAAANAAFEASMAKAEEKEVEATQLDQSGDETLAAVAEFKSAMGK